MVCVAESKKVCTKGAEVANLHGVFWLFEENRSPESGRGEQTIAWCVLLSKNQP